MKIPTSTKITPRTPWTIFQPVVETAIAMNGLIPATIATTPKSTPIVVTLVMSKRKITSEKTSHAIPVRNSHQKTARFLRDLAWPQHVVDRRHLTSQGCGFFRRAAIPAVRSTA